MSVDEKRVVFDSARNRLLDNDIEGFMREASRYRVAVGELSVPHLAAEAVCYLLNPLFPYEACMEFSRVLGELAEPLKPRYLLEVDYDPKGVVLEALQKTIAPDCRGFSFSANGIIASKSFAVVATDYPVRLKIGYAGSWFQYEQTEVKLDRPRID